MSIFEIVTSFLIHNYWFASAKIGRMEWKDGFLTLCWFKNGKKRVILHCFHIIVNQLQNCFLFHDELRKHTILNINCYLFTVCVWYPFRCNSIFIELLLWFFFCFIQFQQKWHICTNACMYVCQSFFFLWLNNEHLFCSWNPLFLCFFV